MLFYVPGPISLFEYVALFKQYRLGNLFVEHWICALDSGTKTLVCYLDVALIA